METRFGNGLYWLGCAVAALARLSGQDWAPLYWVAGWVSRFVLLGTWSIRLVHRPPVRDEPAAGVAKLHNGAGNGNRDVNQNQKAVTDKQVAIALTKIVAPDFAADGVVVNVIAEDGGLVLYLYSPGHPEEGWERLGVMTTSTEDIAEWIKLGRKDILVSTVGLWMRRAVTANVPQVL
jgi:hypothetical protein